MISNRIQAALSALSIASPNLEPELGSSGTKVSGRLSRSSEAAAALGLVAKGSPVGAVLLEAVYTGKPSVALTLSMDLLAVTCGTRLVEDEPVLAKQLTRVAIGELCFIAGSRHCNCRGRLPSCEFCGGSGIRPNSSLSERARVSLMNGLVSRHRWREGGLGECYESFLTALSEHLSDAAVLFAEQLRGS